MPTQFQVKILKIHGWWFEISSTTYFSGMADWTRTTLMKKFWNTWRGKVTRLLLLRNTAKAVRRDNFCEKILEVNLSQELWKVLTFTLPST